MAAPSRRSSPWREHVEEIGRRLHDAPPRKPIALLTAQQRPSVPQLQYTLKTPDADYIVTPLAGQHQSCMMLFDFIRMQVDVVDDPSARLPLWHVPKDLRELSFEHDLVYRSDVNWQQWVRFALGHLGLEYVDVEEPRTLWVAHCDPTSASPGSR